MLPNDRDPLHMPEEMPAEDSGRDATAPQTADELLREQTFAALAEQQAKPWRFGGSWLLLVTMVLFALSFAWFFSNEDGFNITGLVFLVVVIFFHEMGHWAAMRLFGYRDLQIFFIPFFGAAAAGRKHAAPAWQQGIVILAGPMPGIAVGVALALLRGYLPWQPPWLDEAIVMLLVINVFNLLPLMPLDGGRLLQLTIFNRHPLLETLFQLFAVAGLGLIAWGLGVWVLGILAALMLFATPAVHQKAKQRRALRREEPNLPADLADLSSAQRERLFERAWEALGRSPQNSASMLATMMRTLHEEAITPSPRLGTSFLLLCVFAMGWLTLPVLAVVFVWQSQQHGRAIAQQVIAERNAMAKLTEEAGAAGERLQQAKQALTEAKEHPELAPVLRLEAEAALLQAQFHVRKAIKRWNAENIFFEEADEELVKPWHELFARLRQLDQDIDVLRKRLAAQSARKAGSGAQK